MMVKKGLMDDEDEELEFGEGEDAEEEGAFQGDINGVKEDDEDEVELPDLRYGSPQPKPYHRRVDSIEEEMMNKEVNIQGV